MRAQAVTSNWITAGRYDLLWYIGPCLLSYLLMFLHFGLAVPVMVLWWTWVVVVDGPHVFGTISRTYLDAEEWRRRKRLLLGALIWFVPGPACVLLGILSNSHRPYHVFLLFASLWAYWHVVRQHYGFLALYQRKNGESAGQQNRVDYWAYYTLMLAPLGCFMILNKHAREEVLMLPAVASQFERGLLGLLQVAVVAALSVYAGKEWNRWRRGEPLNVPKNLFLVAVVPVHLIVCMHPQIAANLDLLMFSVIVTFHHNIQYHGIVWYYNRNRYRGEHSRERFGRAATWVSRSFWTYYLAGLAFTFVVRYSSWIFTGMKDIPGGPGPNFISAMEIGADFTVAQLAVAFWWGFALHHYYLDQKIWRVSKDERLRSDLRVA
jgi:hypothetical protein